MVKGAQKRGCSRNEDDEIDGAMRLLTMRVWPTLILRSGRLAAY
jgi:hypothetical protein